MNAHLEELNARAIAGEPGANEGLSEFIQSHPEYWTQIGDLTAASQVKWITRLTGSATREAVTCNLNEWLEQLIGPDATPIERAIGETAVSAKLALTYAETQATAVGDAIAVAEMKARRVHMAQNRMNATLKNLAQVRRLRLSQGASITPRPPFTPAEQPMAKVG